MKKCLTAGKQRRRNKAFEIFFKESLDVSPEKYDLNNISKCEEKYSKIVVGSDQVWNLNCTGSDLNYFLKFVSDNSKKYSYAASVGKVSNSGEEYDSIYNLINQFQNVSVREEAGKHFLEGRIKKEITVDCDPTFLLSRDEWLSVCKARHNLHNYIFVYSVNLPKTVVTAARKIASDLRKKIVFVTLRNKKIELLNNELELTACGPGEFLALINGADLVITNSFHGTALSIILEKNFYLVRNEARGLDNSRMDNLLEKLNLTQRILHDQKFSMIKYEYINYSEIKPMITRIKVESEERLRAMLS